MKPSGIGFHVWFLAPNLVVARSSIHAVRSSTQSSTEELVAELGAAFLYADLGLANEPRPNHAAYAATWIKVLREDSLAIFTAASKAQQAVDYAHAQQPQPAAEAEATPTIVRPTKAGQLALSF